MLQGATIFAGDSITVGLKPFVQVNGDKREAAKGGQSAAQLLTMLQGSSAGDLAACQNMVVLIGTNDIGGGRTTAQIVSTIRTIWALAKSRGLRVFAMTIPPAEGYVGFADFGAVNARRKAINAALGAAFAAGEADGLIDLSVLLTDAAAPEKLAARFDSGDHLHPRKDALGAVLNTALASTGPAPPLRPGQPAGSTAEPFPWTTAFLLVGMAVGGTIFLARKDSSGTRLAERILHHRLS